jgi:hypothetical protein
VTLWLWQQIIITLSEKAIVTDDDNLDIFSYSHFYHDHHFYPKVDGRSQTFGRSIQVSLQQNPPPAQKIREHIAPLQF